METMLLEDIHENLHRTTKLFIDSGEASSIEEADNILSKYRIAVTIDETSALNATHQATLLTIINIGKRSFLGGVYIQGLLDTPLLCPMPLGNSLKEAVIALGGNIVDELPSEAPHISIGSSSDFIRKGFSIKTTFDGWRAGIMPSSSKSILKERIDFAPAGILAGALAVNEAFMHLRGNMAEAGFRTVGMSLWEPGKVDNWMQPSADEPKSVCLPTKIWLIGLGHLGQAYLWTIGMLPYPEPAEVDLVLQDIDRITQSTLSTSILSQPDMIRHMKTRAMATWAEKRGFNAKIQERYFDETLRRRDDEPAIALCGLDNALGRQALEDVGFKFIVEAGLGNGANDFSKLRLHTFPNSKKARDIWEAAEAGVLDVKEQPGYKALSSAGITQCGLTLLAEKAVGAPFVGTVAATLAISEIIRFIEDGQINSLIDIDLKSLRHRTVAANNVEIEIFNPGYVREEN